MLEVIAFLDEWKAKRQKQCEEILSFSFHRRQMVYAYFLPFLCLTSKKGWNEAYFLFIDVCKQQQANEG